MSTPKSDSTDPTVGGIDQNKLQQFVLRIESLITEREGFSEDIKTVYLEAKVHGFEPKILRQIIKMRAMNEHDRQEMEALVDMYAFALNIPRG